MNDLLFNILYKDVMKMLRENLPATLFYHSPEHTMDVIQAAERIALSENCGAKEVVLLKTAALFHDTGYIHDMREHEKHGCGIASGMLSSHGVGAPEIETVCDLIMATKVPQNPKTKLEEIICDADLDYLGRDDYFTIAENLYREFSAFEKVKDEKDWIRLQVNFLESHSYFTKTCIRDRQPLAAMNLQKIRETVTG